MERALCCAEFGLGTVSPNPSVGAVVFDPVACEVVGIGWTQPGGRPHAEPVALEVAGERARGGTMAVTLEPCVHFGRSPPCTGAIIESGIARVVYAIPDPDPRVAGKGAAALRSAGLAVSRCGPDQSERARWITLGHIVRVTERRPLVQIKIATDADGQIAFGGGRTGPRARPVWVTSPAARAMGHVLRAKADAIAVGTGTVGDDDPDLTCRLPGCAKRSPLRVVIGNQMISSEARLAASSEAVPVVQYVGHERGAAIEEAERQPLFAGAVERVPVTMVGGKIWLPAVMENLVQRGVTRLLVEGGARMWRSFAEAHLVDEVVLFTAARATTSDTTRMTIDRAAATVAHFLPGLSLEFVTARHVGDDMMVVFRNSRFRAHGRNDLQGVSGD